MRMFVPLLWVFGGLSLLAACGDDDPPPSTGVQDAGLDGGTAPNKIPRTDSGVPSDTAVPYCDRFDTTSCDGDTVCAEVIEVLPDTGDVQIYTGCVEVSDLRGPGDPCTPWNDRYKGVSQEVYYDSCATGYVCSDDPDVRGATTCQPVCQTGAFGDDFVGCESKTAFCAPVGAYQEYCIESDRCDPTAQQGCDQGEACYLRLTDRADGYLTLCLPVPESAERIADHDACTYVNDCNLGSSCTGPVNLAPEDWLAADYACRPLCTGQGADDNDAGTADDDAGTSTGDDCPGIATCVPFASSSLDLSALRKPPFGQCER
jgi:hypothetical protein